MTVRRSGNFGTYFFIGFIGMLIGSVIGRTLVDLIVIRGSTIIRDIIYLNGFAYNFAVKAGYIFNLNLFAILGIITAIYIYRRI